MVKDTPPDVSRSTRLSEVMVREVVSLQINDRTSLVDTLMKFNPIHHIPVVEGTVLKGLISQGDLYRNMLSTYYYDSEREQHSFLDNFMELPNIMTRDPISMTPDNTVGEALDTMLEYKLGCIPIVDSSNELVGIITSTDMLRFFKKVIPR